MRRKLSLDELGDLDGDPPGAVGVFDQGEEGSVVLAGPIASVETAEVVAGLVDGDGLLEDAVAVCPEGDASRALDPATAKNAVSDGARALDLRHRGARGVEAENGSDERALTSTEVYLTGDGSLEGVVGEIFDGSAAGAHEGHGSKIPDPCYLDREEPVMPIRPEQLSEDVLSTVSVPLGGVPFSAKSRRIADLADPVNPQDAATKAWVEAQMDYSNATKENTGPAYVASFKFAALANSKLVDLGWEVAGAAIPLFVQVHDIAAAAPALGDPALKGWPASALDTPIWAPPGTWKFVNGIFIGLSTTERVWTPAADLALYAIVRYLP